MDLVQPGKTEEQVLLKQKKIDKISLYSKPEYKEAIDNGGSTRTHKSSSF